MKIQLIAAVALASSVVGCDRLPEPITPPIGVTVQHMSEAVWTCQPYGEFIAVENFIGPDNVHRSRVHCNTAIVTVNRRTKPIKPTGQPL